MALIPRQAAGFVDVENGSRRRRSRSVRDTRAADKRFPFTEVPADGANGCSHGDTLAPGRRRQ